MLSKEFDAYGDGLCSVIFSYVQPLRNRLDAIGGFVEVDAAKVSRAVVNLTAGFLLRIRNRRVVGFLELLVEA